MKRPNWFDWLIYRLFYKVWNPIFRKRPELGRFVSDYMSAWFKANNVEIRAFHGRCSGCGGKAYLYDVRYFWYVCDLCVSEAIAADLVEHAMNPNRGLE